YINKKVTSFFSEGILRKIPVGRSYLCSVNLANEKAVLLLTLIELEKKDALLKRNRKLSIESLSKIRSNFKVHTIFESDARLCFVLDYLNDKDAILNQFPEIRQHNPVFFDKSQFKRELLENKTLLTEKTVLYSYEKYFELVHEIEGELFVKYSQLFSDSKKPGKKNSKKLQTVV
ncbi:MAG: hypothetical protein KKF44_02145, partial [Nanoarchaeota archaeon]|nr:hypothetical protein [Nanoarchaeota archaeon]